MRKSSAGKALLFIVSLFLLIPASLQAEKMTGNWRIAGYTIYRDAVFVDTARLTVPAPGITAAWIKITPSPKSKYRQYINDYLTAVHKDVKRFHSIEFLSEINCEKHLIRFTKFVYLDKSGKIIHQVDESDLRWYLIVQGGTWYPVEKEVCTERK